jgi:hypothetical protein
MLSTVKLNGDLSLRRTNHSKISFEHQLFQSVVMPGSSLIIQFV